MYYCAVIWHVVLQGLEHMLSDAETTVLLLLARGAPPAVTTDPGRLLDEQHGHADRTLKLAVQSHSWPATAALCCVLRPGSVTRVRGSPPLSPPPRPASLK